MERRFSDRDISSDILNGAPCLIGLNLQLVKTFRMEKQLKNSKFFKEASEIYSFYRYMLIEHLIADSGQPQKQIRINGHNIEMDPLYLIVNSQHILKRIKACSYNEKLALFLLKKSVLEDLKSCQTLMARMNMASIEESLAGPSKGPSFY